jgi:hypothetical protein
MQADCLVLPDFAIGVVDELRFSAAIAEANDLLIYDNLVIIASSFIQDLYFNVGHEIIDFKIYQCVIDHDSQEYLMLDGLSTFRRNAIQCWEDKQHDSKFWLGPGVVIKVDPRKGQWTRLYEEPQTKSELNRDRLRSYIEEMDNIKIEGRWWNQFRGPIAGIIDVLTGAIKLASSAYIKASPRGLFVSYGIVGEVLNITVGVAGMKVGAALGLTTVGSAILVSAGVAAAIYFIPWESVFDWLETIASWLQKGIKTIWEKIKDWLADLASTIRNCLMPEEKSHRPFAFPA